MTYLGTKDCYDYTVWGNGSEQMYECLTCGEENYNVRFCFECWPANRDIEYCIACRSSSNCFGCVGVKKKQYCIFNKQYTKEEYEVLVPKIKEHMNSMPYIDRKGRVYQYGEFLSPELSPFAYNETMLYDYFPLSKEQAVAEGYAWKDIESREYQITMSTEQIPDNIDEVQDDILKEILQCSLCKKAFRIVKIELDFYRKMGVPLPNLCSDCRYKQRFSLINIPRFFNRRCFCSGAASENGVYQNQSKHFHEGECPNEFETSYAPDRSEIIYCEECYNSEVV